MRTYSNIISLNLNNRGVYSIDPIIGCSSGTKENKRGCYSDCYAARIANIYGYNFSKSVKRNFINDLHLKQIKNKINKIKLPFIRMGTMGDPSECWNHTLDICEKLQYQKQLSLFEIETKEIVIITKHWNTLNNEQLQRLKKLKICINTSISVLDDFNLLNNSIEQYNLLNNYCRSILRVVTCNFNTKNEIGYQYNLMQESILNKYKVLDTVFRPSKNNYLIKENIINIKVSKFLGKQSLQSKLNNKTYLGKCGTCLEMCGVTM